MPKRAILPPLKQGSRTPNEIRAAVKEVMNQRDDEDWALLSTVDHCPMGDPPPRRDKKDEDF